MRGFAYVTDYRGNPAIIVLTPSDAVSAYALTLAMAAFPSVCYPRTVRADLAPPYAYDETFPMRGHKVVRGAGISDRRIMLAATGYFVHSYLRAADLLAEHGVAVTVVDAYALPLDADPILDLARGGVILAIEDVYAGGLGSELAKAAAVRDGGPRIQPMYGRTMPKNGRSVDDVLAYVGLAVGDIVTHATSLAR